MNPPRPQPPKWAERFLAGYCRHDLRGEVQGDLYELYHWRKEKIGAKMICVGRISLFPIVCYQEISPFNHTRYVPKQCKDCLAAYSERKVPCTDQHL